MEDKLLLLHNFLNDIVNITTEDELTRCSERYRDELGLNSEEDGIYKLWNDYQMLGREILFLKSSGVNAARNRKIAMLSKEEKAELAEVERIIDENRFDYHFQPIVNTVDGAIYSYEALMRPRNEMGLTPFHILKYAKLAGRLNDIERATFLNVLTMIDSDKGKFRGRKVFINSIPKTKVDGDDFRNMGKLLIIHSDTAVVELTEQAELDENELNALKERYMNMDIKVALDDYGTGYSNVQNLLRYTPNYVKIDKSLISDIQNNSKKRHFVREITEFCHENDIMALAEGVETLEELRTVILLGADLIQGFYTARPAAEVIGSISHEIREEIKRCHQERQDGRNQQVYVAEATERLLLDRLVKNDYKCILVGKEGMENGEVTIVGSPSLNTEIHIETAKDFKGKIILENAYLSNVKNRPCIDLAENSDLTVVLKGENRLDKGGIRVPEGAKFTLEGEGDIKIRLDATECFGIGNDISSKHGELIFNQSGAVDINASGKKGICIGSGLGGNITIGQGKYVLNMNSDAGIGLGAFFADCKVDVLNCDFNADISCTRGAAIGSIGNNVDVHISKSVVKLYMGGDELTAVGTIDGDRAKVLIDEANVIVNIRAGRCTCVGALDQSTRFSAANAAFRATAGGKNALPFGGFSRDTKVSLNNVDTTIKLETEVDVEKYVLIDDMEVITGRTRVIVNDNEVDLREA